MDYSDLLTASENKSKTSWNIIKSVIGKANSRNHTLLQFKLDNPGIHINQTAKVFNNYFLNLFDELNIQQANTVCHGLT
jgi:hypothetical protein